MGLNPKLFNASRCFWDFSVVFEDIENLLLWVLAPLKKYFIKFTVNFKTAKPNFLAAILERAKTLFDC